MKPPTSILLRELAVAHVAEGREIHIDLRKRDGSVYISARLYVDASPTHRAVTFAASCAALTSLAAAFDKAGARLHGGPV